MVLSCEEDFTNIGSEVISNTKFDTNSISVDILVENSPLEKVQSDNISRALGQYLLGVYNPSEYEKLEASIVSQLAITTGLKVIDESFGSDTTVVTKIDTVFIKIPYQVSLENSTDTEFKIDSVFGDATKAFNLNIFRSNTFINNFNPSDPTKINSFFSNHVFQKDGNALNSSQNFQFIPNRNDTILEIKRRLFDDRIATKDTLKITINNSNISVPFARIPLNEEKIKELFLDKYESSEFSSQASFNNYFRGLILEATGNQGSLISFNFNNSLTTLNPSLEIYYTNTVLKSGSIVLDTIYKNDSFPLSGFRVNTFNMDDKTYPTDDQIIVQGTAGSEAKINLFGADLNANGIADKIEEIRTKNWLINDATLTLYINDTKDTTHVPERLYLYKSYQENQKTINSQIKDAVSEASSGGIGGLLERNNGKVEKYTFNITDYISDLLNSNSNFSPDLKLKVFNSTDVPAFASDTIFRNFSWNPKAITLFNNSTSDVNKKAVLKISYSKKK
ncbi:hypothetical protein BTO18_13060 [Polaribacter porphyrae]|uniref:DUF4270 domain-containing protein n=2 Tax=Polaribacter porphyrae TaxID=1137780 RepID=A0A2S7WUK6_9FLAO|nr:DUF4270 domain-containing protein [Polaribacter porphyrae]PQJ81011.1 hypothetical protein BTO18_13060 [Polaribacter porphyrae]